MLTADRIAGLLNLLNAELAAKDIRGEIYRAGGAVMCLPFSANGCARRLGEKGEPT